MVNHSAYLLKPGRPMMRLVSICGCVFLLAACASFSRRPTDLQPAVVVPFSPAAADKRAALPWDDCFDRAIAAAPDLIPELAEKCCLISRLEQSESWCRRRKNMGCDPSFYGDSDVPYRRMRCEVSNCQLLKSLQRFDPQAQVTNSEIEAQCRIAEIMEKKIGD